ncbi:fungal-specific transcription factor domain-containing protein [Xylariaceae sp. FL0662B]|nr:fungal-specific transcription factor domain-containing protein [Xylariaceae sp. FL0662B]
MSSNPGVPGRKPRILACVLCQNRKIKCDRNTPCSNCIKANVTCTPSTPAPARKRRRPNQDLQQRLARCEELLSEYATAKPSESPVESTESQDTWKPTGKLIVADGGVKFMGSYLLANIHDEISAMREILEDDETVDESYTPAESQSPDSNTSLILSDTSAANLEDLHPQPAHIFRLWQTFLERVNPICKIIHVPTLQPLLAEAATNRATVPKNVEALLFSIYLMAAVALTDEECIERLGYTKAEAYNRFSKGCRTALIRIGVLRTYDLVVLQAVVLYLFSLAGPYDTHAAWILNGVSVRIAQKMGLHRDGESLGLSPFETEMRRRIWWQIVLLDANYALMSGLGQSLLPRSWDTKKPLNINDADLYPTMTTAQSKDGPTDMIFCLISYEISEMIVESPMLELVLLQTEVGSPDAPNPNDIEKARRRILELDKAVGSILDKYGDLTMGPIHELAANLRPLMIGHILRLISPAREQPEWGTEILTPKDNIFKISLIAAEHNLELYKKSHASGHFMWFLKCSFKIELFVYMVGQLCSRTSGQLVERAWTATELFYHYHKELYDLTRKTHAALATFVLRAWKKRQEVIQETRGCAPGTPGYILTLQRLLPPTESKRTPVIPPNPINSSVYAHENVQSGTADASWDQMLGFVDAGAIDWDMFTAASSGQIQANDGEYGAVLGSNSNSWM